MHIWGNSVWDSKEYFYEGQNSSKLTELVQLALLLYLSKIDLNIYFWIKKALEYDSIL
jgi:hypothetical protein